MRTLFCFIVAVIASGQERIRPVVGPSSRGNGGPALAALLDGPSAITSDSRGVVYIAEANAGVIRRVLPDTGIIERVAGTGVSKDGQEGASALSTDLMLPSALSVDAEGLLVFADAGACRIRRILTDGSIRNVAGTGRCSSAASGFPFPGGGGTRDRPALETDLGTVTGIAFDSSGRLVFSESSSHLVRRLDADGYIRTIAGFGQAAFSGDGGAATSALLNSPSGVALDSAGNLYIADSGNCRIRRVDTDGNIATAAGTTTCVGRTATFSGGIGNRTAIGRTAGIAYDPASNSLYVASPGQARLLRMELDGGRITGVLGNGTFGVPDFSKTPSQVVVNEPAGVAAGPDGRVFTSASTSFQVYQLNGGMASLFAGKWPEPGDLLRPSGSCTSPDGALLLIDAGTERVLRKDGSTGEISVVAGLDYPTGFTGADNVAANKSQIGNPKRILCAPTGEVYLTHGSRIRFVDTTGIIHNVNAGADTPFGVLLDRDGHLVYSDAATHRVFRFDLDSRTSTVIAGNGKSGFSGDGGAATDAQLNSPGDLAFDTAGHLLIADRGNRRVRRLNGGSGKIETVAGSSREFSYIDITGESATDVGLGPITGMTMDSIGNLYIAENSRLITVSARGIVNVLLGYAGEDDAGIASFRVRSISGAEALSVESTDAVLLSVRSDGAVLRIEPEN